MEPTTSPVSLKKQMAWNSAGILCYMALQWLTTVLVVRLGGYADAGNLALAMSFTTVFTSLAFFCVRNYQASDVAGEFQPGDYVFHRVLTCCGALALCAVAALAAGYAAEQTVAILCYMAFRVSEAAVDVLHGIDQRAWRLDIIGRSYLLRGAASFAAFCGLLYCAGNLNLAIGGMALCSLLAAAFYDLPRTRRLASLRPTRNFHTAWRITRRSLPIVVCSQLINLLLVYPRFVLEKGYGAEALGYYATIAAPTVLISVVAGIAFAPFITLLAEAYQRGDTHAFARSVGMFAGSTLLLGGACALGGRLLGDVVLSLLFGAGILPYTWLFVPIIGSATLLVLSQLLLTIYTAIRRLWTFAVACAAATAVTMAAATLLIPLNPLAGTNGATMLGYLALLLLGGGLLVWKRKEIFAVHQDPEKKGTAPGHEDSAGPAALAPGEEGPEGPEERPEGSEEAE